MTHGPDPEPVPQTDAQANIDRFHGAVAVVMSVRFGVAVVEAAPIRQVLLAAHHVHGFRCVTRCSRVPNQLTITRTGEELHAENRVAIDRYREIRGPCRVAGSVFVTAGGAGSRSFFCPDWS